MGDALATNLWNTILPMVLLCGLVTLLPGLLVPRATLSQQHLALGIALTAVLTLLAGAALSALLYAAINHGVLSQVLQSPIDRATFFLGRSLLFALLWGPLLAFVWLVKAQELNRRVGLRMGEGEN
ncbi:MAG: hypothetical protein JNN02_11220 [Tabrizicola sp.]|nr:hypothetical protein [Tabrizicola sp.]